MNYYYDLKLNFQENNYLFYEWKRSDNIVEYKRIPFIHITTHVMNDLLKNKIKITKELLNDYPILFVDKNCALAILFNNDGAEVSRSSLLLDDEINVVEMAWNYKNQDINYEKISSINYSNDLRQESVIKNAINTEIDNIIKTNNKEKLEYLYMEWFGERSHNYKSIINNINNRLKNNITEKEIEVYNLIMLSYKSV